MKWMLVIGSFLISSVLLLGTIGAALYTVVAPEVALNDARGGTLFLSGACGLIAFIASLVAGYNISLIPEPVKKLHVPRDPSTNS